MKSFEKLVNAKEFSGANEYLTNDFMIRHYKLMWRDKTKFEEYSRKLLFCLIAADDYLYTKTDDIYDFTNRKIKSDCLKDPKIKNVILHESL